MRELGAHTSPGRVEQFLAARGADTIEHPGGTLLTHLVRVAGVLADWGADTDIQQAGLCHAMYGTDGFDRALLDLTDRATLVELIGERAEALVYLYGSCDRSAVYPRIDVVPLVFRDRFTSAEFEPAETDLRAFLEITVANELDVLAHNPTMATLYGSSLYQLFNRCRDRLSRPAWQACRDQLGPA